MPERRASLLRRISAINSAMADLPRELSEQSAPAVVRWLKADLALLEQLRACLRDDHRRLNEESQIAQGLLAAIRAFDAAIAAKSLALEDVNARIGGKRSAAARDH